MASRTLALIKPDAVANGNVGNIVCEIEAHRFNIVDMWMTTFTLEEAEEFYGEHRERPFFGPLTAFMSSGPLVVLVLEHAGDAITRWRALMGPADANKAPKGTLRSLYGDRQVMYRNAVHGSDSEVAFERELALVLQARYSRLAPSQVETLVDESDVLNAALEYGRRGFRVLPVYSVSRGACSCSNGTLCLAKGKHPRVSAWAMAATNDLTVIRKWWSLWPDSNVGLVMGGPERFVAIDVDGDGGRRSLGELEAKFCKLPDTLTQRTGDGEHRFFRLPKEHDLSKFNKYNIVDGLDVKSEGSYVVVPPSIHSSGHRYAWTSTADVAELPQWFCDLAGK